MAKFTFIDLFAGIGGFRQALESCGGECVGFSEIYNDAIKAYCTNYGEDERANLGDITKIKELPSHDFLTGGVPCQSWSIAGKNLGFDDDRGQLWNDTLYLLNQSKPKAFIFENVKGLADPRNGKALEYIMERIRQAGYYAYKFLLNAYDYGVPQTRVRIYIVGFREKEYYDRFLLPLPYKKKVQLSEVLDDAGVSATSVSAVKPRWSLSCNEKGFNNYFLFNDLRSGSTTIHSWDILETTERQKHICNILLRYRRKSDYGPLDGNPLSLRHFQELDETIKKEELDELVEMDILKKSPYLYRVKENKSESEEETFVLTLSKNGLLSKGELRTNKELKVKRIDVSKILSVLSEMGAIECVEERYEFRNGKISTGLFGVNRIFLPSSDIYPTLVASDSNDYVTPVNIEADTLLEFKEKFMKEVYAKNNYRRISKAEACRIQGFPADFVLPKSRSRWMHLIGNSVAVPVVRVLAKAVVRTGVFGGDYEVEKHTAISYSYQKNMSVQPSLF